MNFNNLKSDKDFYNKLPDNLTIKEQEIMYINVYKIKKKLVSKNPKLKEIPQKMIDQKKYIKNVTCECCGRKMSKVYFKTHKKTSKYKLNMELKKYKDNELITSK
jgi:hypothetical protein